MIAHILRLCICYFLFTSFHNRTQTRGQRVWNMLLCSISPVAIFCLKSPWNGMKWRLLYKDFTRLMLTCVDLVLLTIFPYKVLFKFLSINYNFSNDRQKYKPHLTAMTSTRIELTIAFIINFFVNLDLYIHLTF